MTNRRFEMYHFRQVIVRMRLGESDRAIAKTGLIGRAKCAALRVLATAQGWLDASQPLPCDEALLEKLAPQKADSESPQVSRVEPYRQDVEKWHQEGIAGTTIHQALIRKYHFTGSYSSVRRFVQSLDRANRPVTSVIDFIPGDSAQIDFGQGPLIVDNYTGELRKTWIFVMVLSWSRHMYAEIIRDQRVETWLACHRRAFEWFNGVPARCIIDNPKCAITRACYYEPEVQRAYGDCAEGYGFLIAPCPVRDPQKKGRVESGVKYVKNNFVPLRDFRSLIDANQQLKTWVMEVAGNRIHGTVHQKPYTRFIEIEKALLKPLPDIAPTLASWTKVKVHGDCHVQFEKCRYSVPFKWVGEELWLRASDSLVELFHEQQLLAAHSHLKKPGKRLTVQDHLPPQAQAYYMRDPQWCLKQADKVGPHCKALIEHLFADRVLDNLRAAQGVLGFKKPFGVHRLEAACERAMVFGSPLYKTVKVILNRGLDQQPHTEQLFDQLGDAYQGKGRFNRNTSDLFKH